MAGLLGNDWNDPRTLASLTLAAGLLDGRGGLGAAASRGLLGYQQSLGDAQDRKTKGLLTDAQIEGYRSNAALDQAKLQQIAFQQAQDANFLGRGSGSGLPPVGNGLPAGMASPSPAGGAMTAQEIAQKFNIPIESVIFDYTRNGGKGIAAMVNQSQEIKSLPAGSFVIQGNNLKQFLPNPEKGIGYDAFGRVIALPGAAEAQASLSGAVTDAQEAAKARYSLEDGYDPVARRAIKVPRAAMLGQSPASGPASYSTERGALAQTQNIEGGSATRIDSEIGQIDRQIANTRDPQARADLAAYRSSLVGQRQTYFPLTPAARSAPASIGFPSGPSSSERASDEAERTRAINTASADVVRDTSAQSKTKSASETLGGAERALELLDQGPTGSGLGAMAARARGYVGISTKADQLDGQLKVISSELVKNIPRFEGPQSDRDVEQYKQAAGDIANNQVHPDVRKAAVREIQRLQAKAAGVAQSGAQGSWGPSAPEAKSGWSIQLVK